MKRLLLIILISCLGLQFVQGQNLVINPSFENYHSCPNDLLDSVIGWFNPSASGSPDYYNSCSAVISQFSTPLNGYGFQVPKSGNGYAAIVIEMGNSYYEYVETKLLTPLIKGKRYTASYNVSLADSCKYGVGILGAVFSTDTLKEILADRFNVIPQIENPEGNYIIDKLNWTKIEGKFIASGGEQYMTIGVFERDTNSTFISVGNGYPYAYYYIDDVSVTQDTTGLSSVPELGNSIRLDIYPNPAQDKVTIELSTEGKYTTSLTDILGQPMLSIEFTGTRTELAVSDLPKGIYFVQVSSDQTKTVKKIVIQ